MQSDASSLEQCVRGVEALLGGRASGSAEQELSRGSDAVCRCRQWCALALHLGAQSIVPWLSTC